MLRPAGGRCPSMPEAGNFLEAHPNNKGVMSADLCLTQVPRHFNPCYTRWDFDDRYSRQILFMVSASRDTRKAKPSSRATLAAGATGSAVASPSLRSGVGMFGLRPGTTSKPATLQAPDFVRRIPMLPNLCPRLLPHKEEFAAFNTQLWVEPKIADLTPSNVEELSWRTDLILDGTGQFRNPLPGKTDYACEVLGGWSMPQPLELLRQRSNVIPGETAA